MSNEMAAPVVQNRATGRTSAVNTTSHPITLPSGIQAGELLLVVFTSDGAPDAQAPAGWTKLQGAAQSTNVEQAIFCKFAEGGDTLTITTGVAEQSSHISFRISGAAYVRLISAVGNTANSDPPSLSDWKSANHLWIVTRGGDSTVVATSPPSGYGNHQSIAAAGTGGASTDTAELTGSADITQNPGAWTSASEQWVAFTICITPDANDGIGSFTDDFDDNSLHANWNNWGGAQVAETSQELRITIPNADANYYGVETVARYNLIGNAVFVNLKSISDVTPDELEVEFQVLSDNNEDRVLFLIGNSTIYAIRRIDNDQVTVASATYNATNHQWLRIRESGGTIYWEVASQAQYEANNWQAFASEAIANENFRVSIILLDAGCWDTTHGQVVAAWDNLNIQPGVENGAPLIELNTPDEHVFNTPTPKLEFTGTDPDGDDISYNVRISSFQPDSERIFRVLTSSEVAHRRVGGFTDSGTSGIALHSGISAAQIFEADIGANDTNVIVAKLRLRRVGSGGSYLIALTSLTEGKPNFDLLLGGTLNPVAFDDVTTDTNGEWVKVWLLTDSSFAIDASGQYALWMIDVGDSDPSNHIEWLYAPQGSYPHNALTSNDFGSSWSDVSSQALQFELHKQTNIEATSDVSPGFVNEDNNADTDPFTSGDKISFTPKLVSVDTYYFDASDGGPTDPNGVWSNNANAFDGDNGTDATYGSVSGGSKSTNYLGADGTNAPSSGGSITQVRARVHDGNSYGSYATLSAPGGGWTWAAVAGLEARIWVTNPFGPGSDTINAGIYEDGDSGGTELGKPTGGLGFKTVSIVEIEVTSVSDLELSEDTYYWSVIGSDPGGTGEAGDASETREFVVSLGPSFNPAIARRRLLL